MEENIRSLRDVDTRETPLGNDFDTREFEHGFGSLREIEQTESWTGTLKFESKLMKISENSSKVMDWDPQIWLKTHGNHPKPICT